VGQDATASGHTIGQVQPSELAARAAELTAWCDLDPPTPPDVRFSLEHDTDQTCVVIDDIGAAVIVPRFNSSSVKFFAVAPAARRAGAGAALLDAVEQRARDSGHQAVIFGLSAPGYLWPGVEIGQTGLESLLTGRGYAPVMWAVNQAVRVPGELARGQARRAEPDEVTAVAAFCRDHYPNWEPEASWSFVRGLEETGAPRCAVWVEGGDLLGFACWSVTRQGWFGPMATRPDLREGRNGRGVGTGTLAVALAGLAAEGREHADISWVGPERFYARVAGARTYRAFRIFSRTLA
jgi:GNAT superfamily N-acetyltransferase